MRRIGILLLACVWTAACGPGAGGVRMATTTSVENSGLLAAVLPAYESQARVTVDVLAVGSGQALNLIRQGDAAVGLTHDPSAEAAALAAGTIALYRKIMFNDFIIVGPRDDPAGVAGAAGAGDAFGRIAAHTVLFASRGDASGTYSREQALWELARQRPSKERLLETGQGMGGTLRVADERQAYTLTDRATFEQFQSNLRLTLLFEGGAELLNTYAIYIMAAATGAERDAATALADWFADGDGRRLVADYRVNGGAVFHVWPSGTPRGQPTDRPLIDPSNAR